MKRILITTNHPAPYVNKECEILSRDNNVNVIYRWRKDEYKTWNGFIGKEGKFYDELTVVKFLKDYKECDIAILGGWYNLYCLTAILLSFCFTTKCCVFSDHPLPRVKKNLSYYFKKYILFHCLDYLFCATESTMSFYNQHYGIPYSKLVFFPYTYDDTYEKENDQINNRRANELNNTTEKANIFIANNFIERKGYDAIVAAFKELHQSGKLKEFRIKIAGGGELYESVKEELDGLHEDINFGGWIEPEKYKYLMNHCDIFIHASHFEPFGIPPLDALCRKKLLIVSKGVESVSAIIENGIDGYLFNPNNPQELFEILNNIDKGKIYVMGERGREKVLKTYNDSVFANAISSVK